MMNCLKKKALAACEAFAGLKNLQVSLKGNAEVSLHEKNAPDCPKARLEVVEDGVSVNLTDLLLVGAAVVLTGSAVAAIADLFD